MRITIHYTLTAIFIALGIGVLLLAGNFSAFFAKGWVVLAYMLTFAMFLVPAGRLADLFGRKLLFLLGLLLFCGTSIWGALSTTWVSMIAARASQGVGAAFMWPSIIGICFFVVPEEKRSFAIGLTMGMAGFGMALGPVLGGLLTPYISLKSLLWINVPLALVAAILTYVQVEKQQFTEGVRRLDKMGCVLLSLGVISFLFAMVGSSSWGLLSTKTLIFIALAFVLLAVFWALEKRGEFPVVPPSIMQNRSFLAASLVLACIAPALFSELYYLPHYMQTYFGLSPFMAGIGSLPMLLVWALVSPIAGDLYTHLGAKLLVVIATVSLALGALLFGVVGTQSSYFFLLPGMIISGIGYSFAFSSLTMAGISVVEAPRTSVAAGLLYLFFLVGGSLGLAVARETFSPLDGAQSFLATMVFNAALALVGTLLATVFIKKRAVP